jgi:hypothetical protein
MSWGRPVRAEVAGGPEEYRQKLATDLARTLALSGYPTAPDAPAAFRLVLDKPVPEVRMSGNGTMVIRKGIALPTGVRSAFAVVRANVQVVDAGRRVAFTHAAGNGAWGFAAEKDTNLDAAIKAAGDRLEETYPDAVAKAREEYRKHFAGDLTAEKVLTAYGNRGWPKVFAGGRMTNLPIRVGGLPCEGATELILLQDQ